MPVSQLYLWRYSVPSFNPNLPAMLVLWSGLLTRDVADSYFEKPRVVIERVRLLVAHRVNSLWINQTIDPVVRACLDVTPSRCAIGVPVPIVRTGVTAYRRFVVVRPRSIAAEACKIRSLCHRASPWEAVRIYPPTVPALRRFGLAHRLVPIAHLARTWCD